MATKREEVGGGVVVDGRRSRLRLLAYGIIADRCRRAGVKPPTTEALDAMRWRELLDTLAESKARVVEAERARDGGLFGAMGDE